MSMQQIVDCQREVFELVNGAAQALTPAVPVYDHVPVEAPPEHIRIDGFDFHGDEYKRSTRGRHSFIIHFFEAASDQPVARTGQKRAKEVMVAIHDAMKAGTVLSQQPFHHEFDMATDRDGATVHALSRYSVFT